MPTCIVLLVASALVQVIPTLIGKDDDLSVVNSYKKLGHQLGWTSMITAILTMLFLSSAHLKNGWLKRPANFPENPDHITFEEIRRTLALVPNTLVVAMGFGIAYNSMDNGYSIQACFYEHSNSINGQFFGALDPMVCIVWGAMWEIVILPCIERKLGRPVPLSSKFFVGFVVLIAANISGVVLEDIRSGSGFTQHRSNCAAKDSHGVAPYMSNMSAWWLLIPYFLTGVGEILVTPTLQNWLFDLAPARTTSLMQGFQWLANGSIAVALTTPYGNMFTPDNFNWWTTANVDGWQAKPDQSRGSIKPYYYLTIALTVVFFAVFLVTDKFGDAKKDADKMRAQQEAAKFQAGSEQAHA